MSDTQGELEHYTKVVNDQAELVWG
jgi:hypothetical protein